MCATVDDLTDISLVEWPDRLVKRSEEFPQHYAHISFSTPNNDSTPNLDRSETDSLRQLDIVEGSPELLEAIQTASWPAVMELMDEKHGS